MYFVTGASGLIGSFICRELLQREIPFKALKRENSSLKLLEDVEKKIHWVTGDILDPLFLQKELHGVDTVIHSAAVVSFHDDDKYELFNTNIEGTKNLVNASLLENVRHFIHISSVAALGRTKDATIIDEETKWENSDFNTNYAKTKYLSELEVWRGHMEGMKSLIINPSVVLGPGDWNKSSTQIFKYVWNEKPFLPKGSLNYIDIRDLIDILFQLIDKKIFGERFILNTGNISYDELLDLIAKNFSKKKPSFKINGLMLKTAVYLEKWRSAITGSRPLLTKESTQLGRKAFIYNNKKVVDTLKFQFRPITKTVEWVCKELTKKEENL
jgi:dihydroflavonol-4-reductase